MNIYNDFDKDGYLTDAREWLGEQFIQGDLDEITRDDIENEIQGRLDDDWYNYIERNLINDIEQNHFVCSGTLGLWDGTYDGGGVLKNRSDFFSLLDGYTIIDDEDGRLFVTSIHHDGSNKFELRRLTDLGREYYEKYGDVFERRTLVKDLWSDKFSETPNVCWDY